MNRIKGTKPRRLQTRVASRRSSGVETAMHAFAVSYRNGSLSRTRTCDRSINSRLLYQLSYQGSRAGKTPRRPGGI